MEYSIHEFAKIAGVSTRTLRWYHEIDLLQPARIGENGYRIYTSAEADRLQHILFYRELGVGLAQIKQLLDDPDFDRLTALRSHLDALESEYAHLEQLIQSVRQSIRAEERKEDMSDTAKFNAFKKDLIAENEKAYGKEIREKYGDESVDASNRRLMGLSAEEYDQRTALEEEIRARLNAAVKAHLSPDGPEGQEIAVLHREWIRLHWGSYSSSGHAGLVTMYPEDARFCAYYDAETDGCAAFLRDAVLSMLRKS
ncbi:MAG: MerR family transcriptional regulator [Butyricicoccus sp.]|nr:MerR family transcriptional regulator [Butyricicoccus sp.]